MTRCRIHRLVVIVVFAFVAFVVFVVVVGTVAVVVLAVDDLRVENQANDRRDKTRMVRSIPASSSQHIHVLFFRARLCSNMFLRV